MSENLRERYFFALVPDEETAKKIHHQAAIVLPKEDKRWVPVEKIHMTLAYLGPLQHEQIEQAKGLAREISFRSFQLQINQVGEFRRIKVLWLGPVELPEELLDLVAALHLKLKKNGFRIDDRPFTPHITLARKYKHPQWSEAIEPIDWSIQGFCLMKSINTGHEARYERLECWDALNF